MISATDISVGVTSLKTAIDIVKGLRDISNTAERNAKVIELQGTIMDAYAGAIEAKEAHTALIHRIGQLEEEITRMKTWEGEKQKYELKGTNDGAFSYMLKPDARGTQPPHWLCTNCYEQGRKSIMQHHHEVTVGRWHNFECPACGGKMQTRDYGPQWS